MIAEGAVAANSDDLQMLYELPSAEAELPMVRCDGNHKSPHFPAVPRYFLYGVSYVSRIEHSVIYDPEQGWCI